MSRYIDIEAFDDWHDDGYDLYASYEALHNAPSIELEPKRGEWIDMGDFEQCSVCKGTHLKEFQSYYGKTTWIKTPYCPNCGADMRNSSEKPNNSKDEPQTEDAYAYDEDDWYDKAEREGE